MQLQVHMVPIFGKIVYRYEVHLMESHAKGNCHSSVGYHWYLTTIKAAILPYQKAEMY